MQHDTVVFNSASDSWDEVFTQKCDNLDNQKPRVSARMFVLDPINLI